MLFSRANARLKTERVDEDAIQPRPRSTLASVARTRKDWGRQGTVTHGHTRSVGHTVTRRATASALYLKLLSWGQGTQH